MNDRASSELDGLPAEACPRDAAIVSLTLNPEYIAKSYFPADLLETVGIEVVGSRPKKLTPQKKSRNRTVEPAMTTELYAAGPRSALRAWGESIQGWSARMPYSKALLSIEEVSAPSSADKLKGELPETGVCALEAVFHATELEVQDYLLSAFESFLAGLELDFRAGRQFFAKGLWFLELTAPADRLVEIARFAPLRILRQMPRLRAVRPAIRTEPLPSSNPVLPEAPAVSNEIRVAIFDGGIPDNHPLLDWASSYEFEDMGPPTENELAHGVGVTSAALFGHIDPAKTISPPFARVDHYRVLDGSEGDNRFELTDVLDRVESVLSSQEYDFVNLSLGPALSIEDDDVHVWTAVLDDRLSKDSTLLTVAVGNNGESDSELGLDRIQVPADCVNALSVGACNSPESEWGRAPYSAVGPGRQPGLVKPEVVDFGGVLGRPFVVLAPDQQPSLTQTAGTSYSAPSVLRLATGIRAHFGSSLSHLAIRTLLVHTAEKGMEGIEKIGWGRAARTVENVVTCDDDSVRVVYQGEISPAKAIRAPIPIPSAGLSGMIEISSTICYASTTDPHHPSNYTRARLTATFRPHDQIRPKPKSHAKSAPFFGPAKFGATEIDLRQDSKKWENVLHAVKRKRSDSLSNPCFDVHYNARLEGRNFLPDERLSYAMVISVRAKDMPDLYNQIVREYGTIIQPLTPILEVPVTTRG